LKNNRESENEVAAAAVVAAVLDNHGQTMRAWRMTNSNSGNNAEGDDDDDTQNHLGHHRPLGALCVMVFYYLVSNDFLTMLWLP
jgi:hypothetical protein